MQLYNACGHSVADSEVPEPGPRPLAATGRQAVVGSFFFSSRRRHTRSDRDWSSDVCSSDLGPNLTDPVEIGAQGQDEIPTEARKRRVGYARREGQNSDHRGSGDHFGLTSPDRKSVV